MNISFISAVGRTIYVLQKPVSTHNLSISPLARKCQRNLTLNGDFSEYHQYGEKAFLALNIKTN